jgi:phage I-like protein
MKTLFIIAALGLEPGKDELPEWFCIFPEGKGEVEDVGQYLVDRTAWDIVSARLERRGVDIVFDYEHQTLNDGKAPAAGWCRQWRYTDGVGIEAKIEWTEEAAGYLKKGEYRYFSPVFHIAKNNGRVSAVHSVALTNAPRTNKIKPLLAKLGAEFQNEETKRMDLLAMLVKALGLKAEATNDDVVAAVAKLSTNDPGHVVSAAVVAALGIDENDESTVVASIHALRQTTKTMVSQADFDLLQAKLTKRDADEVVAKAVGSGKVTPDMLPWATEYATRDLSGFNTFIAKAPVVVPLTPLPDGDTVGPLTSASGEVLAVAKLMDIPEADLKTFGGLEA